MECLYRRGSSNILYMKFEYLGQTVHRSTKTTDPVIAQRVIEETKRAIAGEPQRTPQSTTPFITLSKAIEEVYDERWVGIVSGRDSYRRAYHVVEILGDLPVSEIDTKKVRLVHAHLRREVRSEGTVNRYMAAFRTALRHAAESYNLPCPVFRLKKEENGRKRIYSRKEETEIIDWFRNSGYAEMADITTVLIDTGLRLSECLGIGKRDKAGRVISEVNTSQRRVTSWVNKAMKPRTIPLTQRVAAILAERGKIPFPCNKHQFARMWHKMQNALHLEKDCVAHACRHTCATRLLETGSSLLVVKEWLGHSCITITAQYLHLTSNALEEAVARLERLP